jgi:hypothetical protein
MSDEQKIAAGERMRQWQANRKRWHVNI